MTSNPPLAPPVPQLSAIELSSLASVIEADLVHQRFKEAFVYAWLVLVREYPGRYRAWAREALAGDPADRRRRLDERWVSGHEDLGFVATLCASDPLLLLSYLDRLAAMGNPDSTADGPGNLSESLYEGGMLRVKLEATTTALLTLPLGDAEVHLVKRSRQQRLAPAQRQLPDPNRFNPNWYVVPVIPDIRQRDRRVEARAASEGLRDACRRIAKRESGKVNVYLAEFRVDPVFLSSLSADQGGGRLWCALGLDNIDAIQAEVLAHLVNARSLSADVVVFPELTLPPAIVLAAQQWLLDENCAFAEPGSHAIGWVIAGSFHAPSGPDATEAPFNTACAIDARGNFLPEFAHQKMTSVSLGGARFIEGNQIGQHIALVETPLGLQSVLICLDLCQDGEGDRLPLSALPIDWLWVPSMSPTVKAHQARAAQLSVNHAVRIACANQAAAVCSPGLLLTGDARQSFMTGPDGMQFDISPAPPATWKLYTAQV